VAGRTVEEKINDLQEYIASTIKTRDRQRIADLENRLQNLAIAFDTLNATVGSQQSAIIGLVGRGANLPSFPVIDL
jgi:hypothetical protein